jgi:hypothetical protein
MLMPERERLYLQGGVVPTPEEQAAKAAKEAEERKEVAARQVLDLSPALSQRARHKRSRGAGDTMLTCARMCVSQRAEADEMEAEGEVRVTQQQLKALGERYKETDIKMCIP